MTNEERIKSMTTEELSKFLCELNHDCYLCPADYSCYHGHTGMVDWLKLDVDKDLREEFWKEKE